MCRCWSGSATTATTCSPSRPSSPPASQSSAGECVSQGVRERARVPQLVMLCHRWAHLQCFAGRTGRTAGCCVAGKCAQCCNIRPFQNTRAFSLSLQFGNTHTQNLKVEDTGCLSKRIHEGEGAVNIFQFKSLVFMDQILLYEPSLLQCLKSSLSSSSYSFIPTPAQSEASATGVYCIMH